MGSCSLTFCLDPAVIDAGSFCRTVTFGVGEKEMTYEKNI